MRLGRVCRKREIPQFIREEVIGLRSKIKQNDEITAAIEKQINDEQENYSSLENQDFNPWINVKPEDWYEQKRISCGIKLNKTAAESNWLYSMAKISNCDLWPGREFKSNSDWIVDGPFFLSPTRKSLKNDTISNSANAGILEFVISNCVPNLAKHLLKENHLFKLNRSTPLDTFFDDEVREPSENPFHRIIFTSHDDENSSWGKKIRTYKEIYSGKPIYCNFSGQFINANLIRRIPNSWKLDASVSISQWLQSNEQAMKEVFTMIPYSMDEENPEIINEENYPLSRVIPEIDKDYFYELLDKAGLIEELNQEFPNAVQKDWYKIPVDEDIKCLIFSSEPTDPGIFNLVKKYAINSSLKFVSGDDRLAKKFSSKVNSWVENGGYYCLTVQNDATAEWWFDRFMERIIRDKIQIPKSELMSIASEINSNENISFFVSSAKVKYKPKNKSEFEESQEELVIVTKKFKSWSNWTILANTMTAWNINRKASDEDNQIRLWKMVNLENHTKIKCNNQIYYPVKEYKCDNCDLCFNPGTQSEGEELPACPNCRNNDSISTESSFSFLEKEISSC